MSSLIFLNPTTNEDIQALQFLSPLFSDILEFHRVWKIGLLTLSDYYKKCSTLTQRVEKGLGCPCTLHTHIDVNRNKWILNKVFWRLGSSAGAAVRKLNQPPGHCPGFSAQNSFLLPLYGYRTSKSNGFVGRFQLAHFWMLQKQLRSR